MRDRMTPADYAVTIAESVLGGKLGLIEGSRVLASVSQDLVSDWREDHDFLVVGAFASETDHLAVGSQREGWNAEALAKQDLEVARMETSARTDVFEACRSIVSRFRK